MIKLGASTFNEFVVGYARDTRTEFLYNCPFAVLIPDAVLLDQRYGEIKIREISITGGSIPYNGKYPTGDQGAKINVNWRSYKPDHDFAFNFHDDSIDEIQSFLQGTEPSIIAGMRQYVGRNVAMETSMLCSSTYYSQIPEENKLKDLFNNGFYNGLDELDARLTNAKVPQNYVVYVWVNASTYKKQAAEARENHILANTVVVEVSQGGIIVKKDALKYGRFVIIQVADDIMVDKVDQLDGVSEGQEAGGVVPADDAKQIQALIIPDKAGWLSNQYITANLWYNPLLDPGEIGYIDSNITELTGDFRINKAGPNPEADAFALKGRIRNGRGLFEINKQYCFSVESST